MSNQPKRTLIDLFHELIELKKMEMTNGKPKGDDEDALGDVFKALNGQFGKRQRMQEDDDTAEEEEKEEKEEKEDEEAEEEKEEKEEKEDEDEDEEEEKYGPISKKQLEVLRKAVEKAAISADGTKELGDRELNSFMRTVFEWRGGYRSKKPARKRTQQYTETELLNIEKIAAFINLALTDFAAEIKKRGKQLSGRLGTIRCVLDLKGTPITYERNPLHVAFNSKAEFDAMVRLLFKSVVFFKQTLAKPPKPSKSKKAKAAVDDEEKEDEDEEKEEEEKEEKEEEEKEKKEDEDDVQVADEADDEAAEKAKEERSK